MNVWVDIEIYLNNLKDKEIMKVIWHIWILDWYKIYLEKVKKWIVFIIL